MGGRNPPPLAVLDSKKPGLFRVKESKQNKEREKHYQTSQNLPNHAGPCAKRRKKFGKE